MWKLACFTQVVGLIIVASNEIIFFFLENLFKTDFCKNSVKCLNVPFNRQIKFPIRTD